MVIGGTDVEAEPTNEKGTCHFPQYDVKQPIFYHFETYLPAIDGEERSQKTAREMSVDVSKYLRYACGPSPDWSRLTDHDQLIGFVEKLKREEVKESNGATPFVTGLPSQYQTGCP